MSHSEAAARPRIRRTAVLAALAVSAAALLAAWGLSRWGAGDGADRNAPLPAARAEVVARSLGVAFEASQESWAGSLAGQVSYAPAELHFFTRSRVSACAGTEVVTGPFYCRLTREASFDLAFLDELGQRLRRDAELGWTLVAARIVAAHAQGELGLADQVEVARRGIGRQGRAALERRLALQADCLTGVWAANSRPPLTVPEGFYYELLRIIRNVADDRAKAGPAAPAGLDPFRPGRLQDREAAFRTGAATGDPAACPAAYPAEDG